jgi:hypothetical protein
VYPVCLTCPKAEASSCVTCGDLELASRTRKCRKNRDAKCYRSNLIPGYSRCKGIYL